MTKKKKIAICFLITKDVVNPQVWEQWWRGNKDKIAIYSHYSRNFDKKITITWLQKTTSKLLSLNGI